MEKRFITTRVNWPLSWECWAIQLISKQLLHTGPEHVPHTHFEQLQHFILVLFDWLMRVLVLLWIDMPQQLLECVSDAIHGSLHALQFLWWAQLFCQFDDKIY